MKFSAVALSLAAFATGAAAQLEVLVPGGPNLWWLAQSDNVVSWTCQSSPFTNFTVLIANSDQKVLTSPQAFIAQQDNFQCSRLISKDMINMPVATGYTIQLADPFNNTHILAESQPFEIKDIAAGYPPSSATPTGESAVETGGVAAGSASATSAGTSSTASSQGNGVVGMSVPSGLAGAVLAVFGLMFA